MPKQTYVPTEADRLTGQNVRNLRRLAGETLQQTIDRSGVGISQSSLSNVELGKRQLSLPEATKLAAHFNTTAEKIIAKPAMSLQTAISAFAALSADEPATEQEWLGNPEPEKPTLRAVSPETRMHLAAAELEAAFATPKRALTIDLDNPLSLDEYREQVWIPYLEHRYSADLKAS